MAAEKEEAGQGGLAYLGAKGGQLGTGAGAAGEVESGRALGNKSCQVWHSTCVRHSWNRNYMAGFYQALNSIIFKID